MSLGLLACAPRSVSQPDVLILLNEYETQDETFCEQGSGALAKTGLDFLCARAEISKNLIPASTQSLGSLASFLFSTPIDKLNLGPQHQNTWVAAPYTSLAEKAFRAGWTTAFFASSPVFNRRAGIHQGFSYFQETTLVREKTWGVDQETIMKNYLDWKSETSGPTFAVLTFSDSIFQWKKPSATIQDPYNETLLGFFQTLRRGRQLEKTWIVIAGLNASQYKPTPQRLHVLMRPPDEPRSSTPSDYLNKDPNLSMSQLGHKLWRILENDPIIEPNARASSDSTSAPEPLVIEFNWLDNKKHPELAKSLEKKLESNPEVRPWTLLKHLETANSSAFTALIPNSKRLDAKAFWERTQKKRKTLMFQDPCLRMIDLRLQETPASRDCDSDLLNSVIALIRQSDSEPQIHRATQLYSRMKSEQAIFEINQALGSPLTLNESIGWDILRSEMGLHLPEAQGAMSHIENSK